MGAQFATSWASGVSAVQAQFTALSIALHDTLVLSFISDSNSPGDTVLIEEDRGAGYVNRTADWAPIGSAVAVTGDNQTKWEFIKGDALGTEIKVRVSISSTNPIMGRLVASNGVDNTTPLDVAAVPASSSSNSTNTPTATITPPTAGALILAFDGADTTGADTTFAWSDGGTTGGWTPIGDDRDGFFNLGCAYASQSVGGVATTVTCTRSASSGNALNVIALRPAATAPVMVQHPGSLAINAGDYWYGQVVANNGGSAITGYQWEANAGSGWSNIGGATASAYASGALSTGDSGTQYRCKVTNAIGTTTSNAATVTVRSPTTGSLGDFDPTMRIEGWW
jgi:hypothetical protein